MRRKPSIQATSEKNESKSVITGEAHVKKTRESIKNIDSKNKILMKEINRFREEPYLLMLPHQIEYFQERFGAEGLKLLMEAVVDLDPVNATKHFSYYKDFAFAEEILDRAIEKYPYLCIADRDIYKAQPHYEKMLKKAIFTYASERNESLDTDFFRHRDRPYFKEAIMLFAETNPDSMLGLFGKLPHDSVILMRLKELPYKKELLEKVAKWASEKQPHLFIHYHKLFEKEPYYNALLEEALKHGGTKKYFSAILLSHPMALRNRPDSKQIYQNAFGVAKPIPSKPFVLNASYISRYLKDTDFAETARIAAKKDPLTILYYFEEIAQFDWAEEILEIAARKTAEIDPQYLVNYFYGKNTHIKDQPWVSEVIAKAEKRAEKKWIDSIKKAK